MRRRAEAVKVTMYPHRMAGRFIAPSASSTRILFPYASTRFVGQRAGDDRGRNAQKAHITAEASQLFDRAFSFTVSPDEKESRFCDMPADIPST
jgi:hypothetical protein